MKEILCLILLILTVGCSNAIKLVDSRPECRFFANDSKSFLDVTPSKTIIEELQNSKARFKVVGKEVWLFAENSRGLYFFKIYDLYGSNIGYKDINGADLSLNDLTLIGLAIDDYDKTAARHVKWIWEKEKYEIEVPDPTKRVKTPYIALKRPSDCL